MPDINPTFAITLKITIDAKDYASAVAEIERRVRTSADGQLNTFSGRDPFVIQIEDVACKKVKGV